MSSVCVRKRANVLDGALHSTVSSVKDLGCLSPSFTAVRFFFLVFFFSSDNFDFKILINYSKASVIVLPLKQAKESR